MSNSTAAELCIQNAYIPGRGLSDISIDQGRITAVSQPGQRKRITKFMISTGGLLCLQWLSLMLTWIKL